MIGVDMQRVRGQHSEAGLASFMVTTVLIMVIALIIIGFSQVARRNQQEALDRQLNSQAFYAAESGINQAVSIIRNRVAASQEPKPKDNCTDYSNYPEIKLSDPDNVAVTCMLVSTEVGTMYYDTVTENTPTIVPIIPANSTANIGSITLTWRNSNGGPTAASTCNDDTGSPDFTLPTRTQWKCGMGLLRVDAAPQPSGPAETGTALFFYPHKVSGSVTEISAPEMDLTNGGGMGKGHCSNAGNDPKCMATINDLDAPIYYLNLRSIYRNSTVTITGRDTNDQPLVFKGQAMIDVTAKAQDIIKRIQVRVPMQPQMTSSTPVYGIETSESLCKRYSVWPGGYSLDTTVPVNCAGN